MTYLKPRGGSDIMEAGLRERLDTEEHNLHLILSRCVENLLTDKKTNILWQHLNCNEPLTKGMENKFFVSGVDAFVYVSYWQYEKFRYLYNTPLDKSFVIRNAINPIEYKERPMNGKIRLIYTSTPFRGLDILLDSFEMLGRDDVELHVYSSTIIYGSDYDAHHGHMYKTLFEKASNMKGVVYHGYATNDEVIKALQEAHIFAYPSIFEETSCLSLIEAAAAGCRIVSHGIGAIPETSSAFAMLAPLKTSRAALVSQFCDYLNEAVNDYAAQQDMLKIQSKYFNDFYSWDERIKEWDNLVNLLSQEKN